MDWYAEDFDEQLTSPTGWELCTTGTCGCTTTGGSSSSSSTSRCPSRTPRSNGTTLSAGRLETDGETLVATNDDAPVDDHGPLRSSCALVQCPVVVVHGTDDGIIPFADGARLAELTGGRLETLEGVGHLPQARQPVVINHLDPRVRQALQPTRQPEVHWRRSLDRPRRVLYLSSAIGLGHARRDLAIVRELRARRPDVQVDWLTQHPVTAFLRDAGERVHPASDHLVSESGHLEQRGRRA